jgi:glycosyltransferase involved in cell wall biosynthesis
MVYLTGQKEHVMTDAALPPRDSAHSHPDAVTVVVPTHNRAAVLPQTLESILAQREVDVTVVVVDDASSDRTAEVLAQYPEVVTLRHDEPTEQRVARNHGAALARTPWLAFCDDDDLWAPAKLRRQLDALDAWDGDWCACSSIFVDGDLEPIGGQRGTTATEANQRIERQNVIPGGGSGVVVRRSVFEQVGGFREDARFVEDWDLWLKLSRAAKLVCVDELLVAQRQWSRSYSHRDLEAQYRAFVAMTRREGNGRRRSRPLHTSSFEIQQRLCNGHRLSLIPEVPRLVWRSPEDWRWAVAGIALTEPQLRRLRLRPLGDAAVARARAWLQDCAAPARGTVSS